MIPLAGGHPGELDTAGAIVFFAIAALVVLVIFFVGHASRDHVRFGSRVFSHVNPL